MKRGVGLALLLAVAGMGTVSCSKPFQKETEGKQAQLKACFDQGDTYGARWYLEGNRLSPDAGVFSAETQQFGRDKALYAESVCEEIGKGAKCQRACVYGFHNPHSGEFSFVTLDELWKEKDFQLKDMVPSPTVSDDATRNKRADEKHKSMPPDKWNELVTAAIKQHCAIEGMTMEEVEKALGKPADSFDYRGGKVLNYHEKYHEFLGFTPNGYNIYSMDGCR